MNGGDPPAVIGEDDIQRYQRIEHPEVERLRLVEAEEHPVIPRELMPFHQTSGAALRRQRELGLDSQKDRAGPGVDDFDENAWELSGKSPPCA
jgi:hypothetical protein